MIKNLKDIKEFDWKTIRPKSKILIVGDSSKDKTIIAQKCLMEIDKKEQFKFVNIWNYLAVYPQIPINLQYKEYNKGDLDNFYKVQKDYENRNKKHEHGLLVFDNQYIEKSNNESFMCDKFFQNNNLTIIYILPYIINFRQYIKNDFDYIFILDEIIINNQKCLYETYINIFNMFNNFNDFYNILKHYTQKNNSFIVYDNYNKTFLNGIIDDYTYIKNYRCPLKNIYWKLDKIITEKYLQYCKKEQEQYYQTITSFSQINNNTCGKKLSEKYLEDYLEDYLEEDNKVKKIKINPELKTPNYLNYIEKLKPKKIEFKYPKFYPSPSPIISKLKEIVIDNMDIFPPLD